MADRLLTALLHERGTLQPDTTVSTFIDYEVDTNGFAEGLTWAQLHRWAQGVWT
jgi:fatty acid CoA ligase FadD28